MKFLMSICFFALSVLSVSAQEGLYDLSQFPEGSILSASSGKTGLVWSLSTSASPELMQGVFNPQPVLSTYTYNNNIQPASEKYNPEAFKKAVVTDNVMYARYNLQNGPITKDDYITISSEPGVGMKATESGFTVGVALENSDATEKPGLLKIRVMVRYEKI